MVHRIEAPGRRLRRWMHLLLAAGMTVATAGAAAQPTQVIIVRHAERAPVPGDDPPLAPEGLQRAELLADLLAAVPVGAVITTQYRRTQETAAPLLRRTGLVPVQMRIRRGEVPAHIEEVVAAVRQASGVVLVVGHSNTVPGIVAGLSASRPMAICETTFSNLFVLTPALPSVPAVQLKYGRPDVPPHAGCQ